MTKRCLLALLLCSLLFCLTGCDEEGDVWETEIESSTNTRAEEEYAADSATIMIYMVASDLESEGGCATTDIKEMCKATLSKKVNVIIQTGGAKSWSTKKVDSKKVQRFKIADGHLKKIEDVGSCKKVSMTSPDTLASFLSWGMKKYPADRYGVVLWNHGGGSVIGYGSDEYHPDDTLRIDEISKAFKKAKAQVDFVGFDACLMGTIETAYALSNYSDYMIASEETEPGCGWSYTNWLTALAKDPGISMKDLSKQIINDFVDGEDASFWDDLTLALYDLKDTKKVYKKLCSYLKESRGILKKQGFNQMADARLGTRSYGDDSYDQVDIRSYMVKAQIENAGLVKILGDMIVYYRGNIGDSTGMAMYYPYSTLEYYSEMLEVMENIGMNNPDYLGYFTDFVSILSKGYSKSKTMTKASTPITEQLTEEEIQTTEEDFTQEDWYDEEAAEEGYDDTALLDPDKDLTFTKKGDQYILDLTDEQWKSIAQVEMELYLQDGDGYLFMGRDSLVDYNDDGDLIADYDFRWVNMNGQIIPFYIISDTQQGEKWQATGYAPALINEGTKNGADINIYIRWDNEHEDGYVMGYTTYKNDEDTLTTARRNYLEFKQGDKLDFYCDYHSKDGQYQDSYFVGETLTVPKSGLKVSYEELDENASVQIGYHLVDKYRNSYWTEVLEY